MKAATTASIDFKSERIVMVISNELKVHYISIEGQNHPLKPELAIWR